MIGSFGLGAGARQKKVESGGGGGFDPATLSLTGWWRGSYAASPWEGVASAGTSGGRDLTEATNPPAAGAAVNGFTPADFDGTNDKLDNATAMTSYVGAAGSFAVLFYADSAAADSAANAPYSMPGLIVEESNGHVCLAYGSNGVRFGFYAAAYGDWVSSVVAASTGAWHLAQAKFNGTNYAVRVDNGSWTTVGHAYSPTPVGGVRVGANPVASSFFDGRMLEILVSNTEISDDNFDNIRTYCNARYSLSV